MLPGSACVSTIWDFDLLFKELGVQTGEMAYQLRVNTAQQKTQVRFSASKSGSSQLLVIPSTWDLMLLSSMAWVLTVTFPHIEWDTYKQLKKRERGGTAWEGEVGCWVTFLTRYPQSSQFTDLAFLDMVWFVPNPSCSQLFT